MKFTELTHFDDRKGVMLESSVQMTFCMTILSEMLIAFEDWYKRKATFIALPTNLYHSVYRMEWSVKRAFDIPFVHMPDNDHDVVTVSDGKHYLMYKVDV